MLHGIALTINHFGVWVSSLIVMGIMSYLISRSTAGVYYERNTHTIYEEVIVRFIPGGISFPSFFNLALTNSFLGRPHFRWIHLRSSYVLLPSLPKPHSAAQSRHVLPLAHLFHPLCPGLGWQPLP